MQTIIVCPAYIFSCGSSMYFFGYYVTSINMGQIINTCSIFYIASSLGFTGTLLSALSMVCMFQTHVNYGTVISGRGGGGRET